MSNFCFIFTVSFLSLELTLFKVGELSFVGRRRPTVIGVLSSACTATLPLGTLAAPALEVL